MTFQEHKEWTIGDLNTIIESLTNLSKSVEEGNMEKFEQFWISGGTEEGYSKIAALREILVLRYLHRKEQII